MSIMRPFFKNLGTHGFGRDEFPQTLNKSSELLKKLWLLTVSTKFLRQTTKEMVKQQKYNL